MGKSKKSKAGAAQRYTPYGRQTTRITDLCDMLNTATAGTIKEGNQMDDEQAVEEVAVADVDKEEEGEDEKRMTKGKILQRHKREWKALRAKLEDMKSHKKAMGERTLAKKNAKKDLTKEIKALQDEMVQRHKRELEEFEKEDAAHQEEAQKEKESTMSD